MSKIPKTLLITLLLLAFLPAIHAFDSTLLIEGGIGIPLDDIEGTNEMKGAWALAWDGWMIKDWLGIGVSPWFANVEVQGDDPLESYYSSLEGINLYLKLRPTQAGALNFSEQAFIRRISPFVALGGGWSTHGSKDENGVVSNPSVQPGFRGHLTLPHAAAGISFLSSWNTTLDLGVKYDLFTKDNIDLTEVSGSMSDALVTPYIGLGLHFGGKKAVPEIKYAGDLTGFSTVLGVPSAAQSYRLQGSDLKGNIEIVAPEGFVLSIDGGKVWAKSVIVPADFDGDIWVRLTGDKTGSYSGSIGHRSDGAAGLNWPVNGVVTAPALPKLELLTSGLGAFSTDLGMPSDPQSYRIKGSDLTGDITINAPNGYEFSLDGGTSWNTSMIVPAGFDGDIWVRLTSAEAGNFGGNVTHGSPGAPTLNIPVSGAVIAPKMPILMLDSGSLGGFATELGKPSEPQSYKIKGSDLTGDINLRVPEGYEFSLDGGNTWKTSGQAPAGFDGDIWVRLKGDRIGDFAGDISHTSAGAAAFTLPVTGTVTEAPKPEEPVVKDSDGDGIPDDRDMAPYAPEDRDGFMDSDGIPDPDNDADGIPDELDGAPKDPEDKDGFMDSDGIPDPDNDGDGIPDVSDLAPGTDQTVAQGINTKETYNDYEDTDGVPDEIPGNPLLDQLKQDLLQHMVHFDTNLYTIREDDKPFLDRVAEALVKLPDVMIEIQGHTDSRGSNAINEPLSYNRAKVVKDYLVARGVDAEQIESKGYSSNDPIATNDTAAGRQENRRAQMVLIK